MLITCARADTRGFTLVEVLSALLVFSLVTLGLVPLFLTSLRGTNLSRSFTIGKNIGVESMERVRGLPFFVSRAAQNKPVDVLDLYYPRYISTGVYISNCTGGARPSTAIHCPRDIPAGYSISFRATFVAADGQTTVVPPLGYDAAVVGRDEPPTQLVRMRITTSWSFQGRDRSYAVATLLGARISDLRVSGVALANHAVKINTAYRAAQIYDLSAVGGNVESRIETRSASVADQAVRAARLELVNTSDPTEATQAFEGDTAILHAPPTSPTVAETDAPGGTLSLLGQLLAGVNRSLAGPAMPVEARLAASAAGETPKASGGFELSIADGEPSLWVDQPQAARGENEGCVTAPASCLRLLAGAELVEVPSTLRGWALTETGALGSVDRGVRGRAHTEFAELSLLPVEFANRPGGAPLVLIRNFAADVACDATANAFTVSSSATWSGTLRYWQVSDPLTAAAGYVDVPISSTTPLSIGPAANQSNPMVYSARRTEAAETSMAGDLFLFPIQDHGHVHENGSSNHGGFLEELRVSNATSRTDAQRGRTASATTTGNLGGAVRIRTVPLPTATGSGYSPAPITIQVGSLECETEDRR